MPKFKTSRKEEHLEMEIDYDIHEIEMIRTKKTSFKLKIPLIRK